MMLRLTVLFLSVLMSSGCVVLGQSFWTGYIYSKKEVARYDKSFDVLKEDTESRIKTIEGTSHFLEKMAEQHDHADFRQATDQLRTELADLKARYGQLRDMLQQAKIFFHEEGYVPASYRNDSPALWDTVNAKWGDLQDKIVQLKRLHDRLYPDHLAEEPDPRFVSK
jgi:hypothetical protein